MATSFCVLLSKASERVEGNAEEMKSQKVRRVPIQLTMTLRCRVKVNDRDSTVVAEQELTYTGAGRWWKKLLIEQVEEVGPGEEKIGVA